MTELSDIVNDTPIDTVTELPQVNKESADYILDLLYNDSNYGRESADHLNQNNFTLAYFLTNSYKDEDCKRSGLYMGLAVYGMLKLNGPLPKVTCEAVNQTLAEYQRHKSDDYLFRVIFPEVRQKDPLMAEFINQFSDSFENPLPPFEVGLLIYKFIEKQAEMNKRKIN